MIGDFTQRASFGLRPACDLHKHTCIQQCGTSIRHLHRDNTSYATRCPSSRFLS